MIALITAIARRCRAALDELRGTPSPTPPIAVAEGTDARGAGWWDLLPFTAHRITLAPGLETAAIGSRPSTDVRTEIVLEACGGSLDGRTVVDLGCLEGGFTLAFAERGAQHALGIEARELSVQRCELARSFLGLDNAEFVIADLKTELPRRDPFDIVFATGILYHVADPAEMLRSMRAACTHLALIDTHVADPERATHGCSPMTERMSGGVSSPGRMFPEYAPDVSDGEKEGLVWAAYSDVDAFWPTEAALVDMIRTAGFARVEKVDPLTDGRGDRWGVDPINRVMYLAYV